MHQPRCNIATLIETMRLNKGKPAVMPGRKASGLITSWSNGVAERNVRGVTAKDLRHFIGQSSYGMPYIKVHTMQNLADFRGKMFWLYATGALWIFAAFTLFLLCPALAAAATSGLVAAYAFNETSGTTIIDASGNNNTGTFGSGVTRSTQGKFGGALVFNGSSAVTIPDAASLDLTTGMTLEAWVFPTTTSGVRDILIKEGANVDIYNLYACNWRGLPESNVFVGGSNRTAEGTALSANVWTHVAGTYDGATLRLFLNGVQVSSTPFSGLIATSGGALRIGGNSIWGEYFQGRIDEVRIYNRPLSQAELQTDMNTPVSGTPPLDITAPTVPGNLTARAASATQINLAWNASTDNVGVTGYQLERCQGAACTNYAQVATLTATSFNNTGLGANTAYRYRVRAADAAGNLSTYSALGHRHHSQRHHCARYHGPDGAYQLNR